MVCSPSKVTIGGRQDVDYYLNEITYDRSEYYAGQGEAPGYWAGSFAETLGLRGEVTSEAFRSVMEPVPLNPFTGEALKPYANRVDIGFDVTFSPPKSVSVLYALGDERTAAIIVNAQREAVAAGLAYLEEWACVARLGHNGEDRQAGLGFIAALFEHRMSREGDPQLHTHAVIANVVRTVDGRSAAIDGGLIYSHANSASAASAIYDAVMRHALSRDLGVVWVERGKALEIDGIPAGLCTWWSKRAEQIDEKMRELGTSGGRAAQVASYSTRKAKGEVGDVRDLRER